MLSEVFLEACADFYGSFTVDELAERLGVPTVELLVEVEHLIDDNSDALEEEMSIEEEGSAGED